MTSQIQDRAPEVPADFVKGDSQCLVADNVNGWHGRTRTYTSLINSEEHCHLCYMPLVMAIGRCGWI